jgi:hypothetical protein
MRRILEKKGVFEAVAERDIDIFLLEEIYSSQKFRNWLVLKLFEGQRNISKFVGVWHKPHDPNLGSVDALMIFDTVEGARCAILFENKISEPRQDLQSERYFEIGERGIYEGVWQEYVTCLFSPQSYFANLEPSQFFSSYLSYEEFAKMIPSVEENDFRAAFKVNVIRDALQQSKFEEPEVAQKAKSKIPEGFKVFPGGVLNLPEGYMLAQMEKSSPFAQEYLKFCQENFSDLGIKKHGHGSRSDIEWVQFVPEFFEKGVSIIHKMPQGFMDLSFGSCSADELYEAYDEYLSAEMEVKQIGGTAVIRVSVPAIASLNNFFSVKDIIGFSLFKARRLAEIYKAVNVD